MVLVVEIYLTELLKQFDGIVMGDLKCVKLNELTKTLQEEGLIDKMIPSLAIRKYEDKLEMYQKLKTDVAAAAACPPFEVIANAGTLIQQLNASILKFCHYGKEGQHSAGTQVQLCLVPSRSSNTLHAIQTSDFQLQQAAAHNILQSQTNCIVMPFLRSWLRNEYRVFLTPEGKICFILQLRCNHMPRDNGMIQHPF